MNHLLIIGGGAAGLAAAIAAADADPAVRVTVLEGLDRVGKKILVTGNGHCNLTNEYITPENYHSADPAALTRLLGQMPPTMATDFFEGLGLLCAADEAGRVYPSCRQASMVLDVLLLALQRRKNIEVLCNFRAVEAGAKGRRFTVRAEDGRTVTGDGLLIATGGKAAPKQGSLGQGYALAAGFGHRCTPLRPCLVGLQCQGGVFKSLKGIRVRATAALLAGKRRVTEEPGELQFTEYGISGIPAMQLSCRLTPEIDGVAVDFFPEMGFEALRTLLKERLRRFPAEPLEDALLGILNKRVQYALLKTQGLDATAPAGRLTKPELDRLVTALKSWRFPLTGTQSWEAAQTTLGGVPLGEVDDGFASRRQPGLYLAGEVLDAAGDCGGYNLHWAWCSGILAARSAVGVRQNGR